jgi:hypothetical protein
MKYILAFISSFAFVGLKSTQQLNVVHKEYWWILPTSLLMAACEVYIVSTVARNGWGWLVLAIGSGAGLGAMLATFLHGKFIQRSKE